MDLYFQGLAWLYKVPTPDNAARARGLFDRALSADPENVDALIGSAVADLADGLAFFVKDPAEALAAAEAKSTKALSLVPDHARAHAVLGFVYMLTKRATEGIAECEHALALDQNLAEAHDWIGMAKILVGRAEETEGHALEALRLSPRDVSAYLWMYRAGHAKLHIRSYDQAVAWFRRAIEANRNWLYSHLELAAALARLGRTSEAHSAARVGLALYPAFTIARVRAAWTTLSDHPTFLAELRDQIFEGLRKAGLPQE